MLCYADEYGNTHFDPYYSIEQKNELIEAYHNEAKKTLREQDNQILKYSIIDFGENQSVVYVLERKVTEVFTFQHISSS